MKKIILTILLCSGAWWASTPALALTAGDVYTGGASDAVAIFGDVISSANEGQENGIFDTGILVNLLPGAAFGLLEPDGSLSDLGFVGGDGYLKLASDDNGAFSVDLTTLNFFGNIAETPGIWQDIGIQFGLAADSILVVSDGETLTPLPGALPLFASGLGALGLLGWRRKKKAQALAA